MINQEHAEKLKIESGIELEVLEKAKVKSCSEEESYKFVGLSKPGLAFPYYNKEGKFIQARLRKDNVEEGEGRYHQSKGSKLLPYFLKENLPEIYDPACRLVITEGEKKLLSFYSHFAVERDSKFGIIAAAGCYGFFQKDESGKRVLSEGFANIPVSGREIILIPDSDYFLNPEVKKAYDDLLEILSDKGATIKLVDLRNEEDEKNGLDDFLVKYGAETLNAKIAKPAFILNSENFNDYVYEDELERQDQLAVEVEKSQKIHSFPELTGYMKELYDWILATSPIKQPILTYGTVVGIIGTVLSNLYRFNNSHPVLYVMFVARSGSGKDRPLKVPDVIFSDEELQGYIGLSGYRSDASIIDTLPKQRSRIDLLDEVDGVFKISKSENGFQSGIISMLTELWSSPHKRFAGRRTKTEGVYGACWNPCVSILAALTPTAFRENFTKSMMLTGFGGRFLYFIADDNFEYVKNFVGTEMNDVPESIVEPLRHWHSLKKYDEQKKRFYIQGLNIQPEAKALLEEIRFEYYKNSMALEEDNSLSPIAQRKYENLERLLIIHACAENPYAPFPVIDVKNVRWCKAFLEALFNNNQFFISQNVAASSFELMKSKVLQPIAKAGSKGMSHSKALRNSHFKAKEFGEIIRTLEESKLISVTSIKNSKFYFFIGKK